MIYNQRFRIGLLLVLLSIAFCSHATSVDSIQSLINNTKNAREKVVILNKQGQNLVRHQPNNAFSFTNQALAILVKEGIKEDDSLFLETYFNFGLYYASIQQLDTVITIQHFVAEKAKKIGLKKLQANALVEAAIAHEYFGDLQLAFDKYFAALKIFESLNDKQGIIYQYINIGLIYQNQNKNALANSAFIRALSLSNQIQFTEGVIIAYNNLGINCLWLKQFPKALKYFNQVLAYDLKSGDSINIGGSYNNFGMVYLGLKNAKLAEYYFLKSLVYKVAVNDKAGIANTYNNLAETYLISKLDKVNEYLLKSRTIALENNFKNVLVENYQIAYKYHKKVGNYEESLNNYERFVAIQDSLKLDELSIRIAHVTKQYETEKAAKELVIIEKRINQQLFIKRILITVIIFLLILFALLYFQSLKKRKLYDKLAKQKKLIIKKNKKLHQQIIATRKAKNVAESANRAKSQFLSIMSHEIRTPLNAVIGLTNLLSDNNPREDQKENLEILKTSSTILLATLNDVLDLSKIDAGKMEIEEVEFDLVNTLQTLNDLFITSAKNKKLKLTLIADSAIPKGLVGDVYHLNQILSNLISNAIKFTHKGGISIIANCLNNHEEFCTIQFKIIDTGIGIDKDKMVTIFDVFTQADTNTTRKYGGSGLGLSICKKLLLIQGANLQVASEVGVGSEFSFDLKFKKHTKVEDIIKTKTMITDTELNLTGKNILIAEDNQINVFVIKQFLAKWGAILTVAENGKQALELATEKDFDVILMDLHMPIMDGYESATEILKVKPNAKIIAITATTEDEASSSIYDSGMVGFVIKPFQPDDLANKIGLAIG
ncbi:MAG: response regulator [Bacteroidia bacterium]|nr:response regulator [Bacteroidia bacterium]